MIIDTPGMRELGMLDDVSVGLGETFSDVVSYLGRCKFSDCRHQTEPGCAIRAAIEIGELPKERWESYLKLKREANFSDDKEGYLRQKTAMEQENEKEWGNQEMNNYTVRQIKTDEYETVRQLDSDAFRYNEFGDDGEFHRIFADNIRKSPYFIPELDLVAVTNEGFILGHGIFFRRFPWAMTQIMSYGSAVWL